MAPQVYQKLKNKYLMLIKKNGTFGLHKIEMLHMKT